LRAGVIIISEGGLALIERVRDGERYFLFPGGGLEPGETPAQAARREAFEELGLDVRMGRLLATVRYRGREQRYFLAEAEGGRFGSGGGAEMVSSATDAGSYRAVWVPLSRLPRLPVHPRALADLILASRDDGWPERPLVFDDPGRSAAA
jgi:ADP-ribose pyrophosphatase YjhB (NUDIX family)